MEHKLSVPTHLLHKPVFVCENYSQIDGAYANNTDAVGLSLGLAQWNDRDVIDLSAKVWRHTGEGGKWSRQSEELPLHRVLDLALLICETQHYLTDAYRHPDLYDAQNPTISKVALQGSSMNISVCEENPMIRKDIKLFQDQLGAEQGEQLGERFKRLAEALKKMGYMG